MSAGRPSGPPRPVPDAAALLAERLRLAHVAVRRVAASGVAAETGRVCAELGVRRLGVPPDLPTVWRPAGVDVVEDHGLSPADLDALDGSLTGCTLAIAETGSLVLAAGPADGRRALSLVPDVYICVVGEDQVEAEMRAAMLRIAALVRETSRPVVFVSGPSATSDIELQRVEGVHGPRRLVVILTS